MAHLRRVKKGAKQQTNLYINIHDIHKRNRKKSKKRTFKLQFMHVREGNVLTEFSKKEKKG